MKRFTRETARRVARRILHIDDTSERTAFAFALGVAISLSPFLGCHWILAFTLAFALRLNRLAVFTGTLVNNPYTFFPILAAGTQVGSLILGRGWIHHPIPTRADFDSFHALLLYADTFRPLWLPFFVGNMVLSLAAFGPVYFLALRLVRALRRRHQARLAAQARRAARRQRPPTGAIDPPPLQPAPTAGSALVE